MTIDQAVAEARRLQDSADKGWQKGYHPGRVMILASKCLAVLDSAATTPERARELVEQLEPEPQLCW